LQPEGYHGKDANSSGDKPAGKDGVHADREKQEQAEPEELIQMQVDGKDVELREQIQMYALNSRKPSGRRMIYASHVLM
jgi:hypothetical protein